MPLLNRYLRLGTDRPNSQTGEMSEQWLLSWRGTKKEVPRMQAIFCSLTRALDM